MLCNNCKKECDFLMLREKIKDREYKASYYCSHICLSEDQYHNSKGT